MESLPGGLRLLAGPPGARGPESLADHIARLGRLPIGQPGDLIASLEHSGIMGRGGAGFPIGRKWRALAERAAGPAVIIVNGAEGEPRSGKDRVLMTDRPHLVLDGAALAAATLGAEEIVVYVGEEHGPARAAMVHAIGERAAGPARLPVPARLVAAPIGYVSGEATAAVNYVERGDARPTTTPPRPSERGVRGRPTLVQNVESLAYAALIARFGSDWYRSVGGRSSSGTALVTVTGATERQGVDEIELGLTVGELADRVGARRDAVGAILVGGYFGTWISAETGWNLPLDPSGLRSAGLSFGCGMVTFHPARACGVATSAEIIGFMARGSAGQCGPCVHGLRSIADATARLARGVATAPAIADLERWAGLVEGRGACRHPDGAVAFMVSALDTFRTEFEWHARTGRCRVPVA